MSLASLPREVVLESLVPLLRTSELARMACVDRLWDAWCSDFSDFADQREYLRSLMERSRWESDSEEEEDLCWCGSWLPASECALRHWREER